MDGDTTRGRIFVRILYTFRQRIKRYHFGISILGGKGVPCYSTPHCENYLGHFVIVLSLCKRGNDRWKRIGKMDKVVIECAKLQDYANVNDTH